MPGENNLLATIEAVHAAGLDSSLWPRALAAVAEIVGSGAASFEVFDKRAGAHRAYYVSGLPEVDVAAYLEHYIAENPRWLYMPRQRTGDVSFDYQFIDEPGMDKAPFYAELLAPMDLRYFMSAVLMATPQDYACISIQRMTREGHVQAREIDLMKRLLPHMRQAFDVAQRLKGAGESAKSFERAFDWIVDGVAFVAAGGALVYANEALQVIARRNDVIRLRKGALEFLAVDARARFDAALDAVGRLRNGEEHVPAPTDFAASRESDAPPYLVSVRPLARSAQDGRTAARAIVFIRDALMRDGASSQMLRELFGLTAAEANVALALQFGLSLDAYARAHVVSLNTVYTHLRRIREKTGCRSIAELIRKLDEYRIPLRSK
jgi:DNA-binding CsgD family transcriptional regulator